MIMSRDDPSWRSSSWWWWCYAKQLKKLQLTEWQACKKEEDKLSPIHYSCNINMKLRTFKDAFLTMLEKKESWSLSTIIWCMVTHFLTAQFHLHTMLKVIFLSKNSETSMIFEAKKLGSSYSKSRKIQFSQSISELDSWN